MSLRRFLANIGLAAIGALSAPADSAQDGNQCRAAMSCDCGGISAGLLTGSKEKQGRCNGL